MTKVLERPMANRQALNVTMAMVSALSATLAGIWASTSHICTIRTAVAERLRVSGNKWSFGPAYLPSISWVESALQSAPASWVADGTPNGCVHIPPSAAGRVRRCCRRYL